VKLLVVRRDNIGDLVCTTPLFAALRRRFPEAWIGALVNSYNAPVLERNPDVSEVIAYQKLKHLAPGESSLAALGRRLGAFWRLRRMQLDAVVLATPGRPARGLRLARWLGAKQVAGFDDGSAQGAALDLRLPLPLADIHEVVQVYALARLFGVEGVPPPLVLVPDPAEKARAEKVFDGSPGRKVALHISARRPAQRWPEARFAELARALHAAGAQCMLLWSPGGADDALHPGDDAKADAVLAQAGAGTVGYRTAKLSELIGALSACDQVICADGGAMHLAAALGKPVVALFGDSMVERWRPWGVPHRVVRPASHHVADAMVADVLRAWRELSGA
jgi:heptosyltransferase-3